jgi:hypothetical protein
MNTAGTLGLGTDNVNGVPTVDENVGSITLEAGQNVVTLNATDNVAGGVTALTADSLTRLNRSTLLVRGSRLGAATGATPGRGFLRFDDAAQAALDGFEVGGGGAAGSTNISIIPWIVGDASAVAAITATTSLGNTLVTNENATQGLRALTPSEFVQNAAG